MAFRKANTFRWTYCENLDLLSCFLENSPVFLKIFSCGKVGFLLASALNRIFSLLTINSLLTLKDSFKKDNFSKKIRF